MIKLKLKYKLRQKYYNHTYNIKTWILRNIIKNDVIEEYCIDLDLLHDYYNEEPDYYDYRNDRD